MKHTLSLDSFNLTFGRHTVLSNIYLKCETGKITGLLGRNGSGKSCLMKIAFGSMRCTHKSVRIDEQRLMGDYIRHRFIGYLPQHGFLPKSLTMHNALRLFSIIREDLLRIFPAWEELLGHRLEKLSGGHLRLFETMIILLSPYKFCILDEPFSGLAPIQVDTLKQVLDTQRSSKGIIITDHLHKHVTSMADDLYLLMNGRSVHIASPEQLVHLGYLSSL